MHHQTGKYGTRLFLSWVQAQGHSLDTSGISKNPSGLVSIPLKRGPSGSRLEKCQSWLCDVNVRPHRHPRQAASADIPYSEMWHTRLIHLWSEVCPTYGNQLIKSTVFVVNPIKRWGSTKYFLRGFGRKIVAQTRQHFPRMESSKNISLDRVSRLLGLPGTHTRQPRPTTVSRDATHPTRSVPLIPRRVEVCPIYWIQIIKSILEVFNYRLFMAMS